MGGSCGLAGSTWWGWTLRLHDGQPRNDTPGLRVKEVRPVLAEECSTLSLMLGRDCGIMGCARLALQCR